MTPQQVLIEILREWPNNADRFDRYAQTQGYVHGECVEGPCPRNHYYLDDDEEFEGRVRVHKKQIEQSKIDRYLSEWSASFSREPPQRLTNEELSIRHAMNERWLLSCTAKGAVEDAGDALADTQREIDRRARKAGL